MKGKLYKTLEEFEQSSWVKMSSDSLKITEALNRAPEIIRRMGGNTPSARKFAKIVELFKENMGAGKLFSTRNAAILAGLILYWVSPIDVIPDFLPVIGWLDDIGLLAMCVSWIMPEKKAEFETNDVSIKQIDSIASNLPGNRGMEKFCADLHTLREDLSELNDEDLLREADCIEEVIADPLRRIVVTGTFSAGKSTFINCLLGRDLLPTSPKPCTPVLTTIMYGEKEQALIQRKDGSVEVIADLALLRDYHSNLMENAQELNVQLPHELLRDGLTIVDTCGLDYSQLDERTFDELPHSSLLIFVKSLHRADMSKSENQFINEAAGKMLSDQIMVVLNQADVFSAGKEKLSEICNNIQEYFAGKQLAGVQVFSTSAKEPERYDFEAVRREINRRVKTSLRVQSSREAEKLLSDMRKRILDKKNAKAAFERLQDEQKQLVRKAMQEKQERDLAKIEKLAERAKERFEMHLRNYVAETLMPRVDILIEKTCMGEQFVSKIIGEVRDGLTQYIKEGVQNISSYFEKEMPSSALTSEEMVATLNAPGMPVVNERVYDQIGKWLLPGASLMCLLTMGILGWLTSVALPLFVMDKFDVAGKLVSVWKQLGPTRAAREKFRDELHIQLREAQGKICEKVNEQVIDHFVDRCRNEIRKNVI